MRIAATTVTAVSTASNVFSAPAGIPLTRAASSSSTTASSARPVKRDGDDDHRAEGDHRPHVVRRSR